MWNNDYWGEGEKGTMDGRWDSGDERGCLQEEHRGNVHFFLTLTDGYIKIHFNIISFNSSYTL